MEKYLELSKDEMVNLLQELQVLARIMQKYAITKPYDEAGHKRSCGKYLDKAKWLADQGDMV